MSPSHSPPDPVAVTLEVDRMGIEGALEPQARKDFLVDLLSIRLHVVQTHSDCEQDMTFADH